jgi:hypothetical protein
MPSRKIHRIALAAAALLALVCSSAAQGTPTSSRCRPSGSHLLAQDRVLRVYSLSVNGAPAVRACAAGGPTVTLLGPQHPGLHRSLGQFRLAGYIVAFVATSFGVDSGTHTLLVEDVAARRTLRATPAGSYSDAGILLDEAVTDLLPTSHGSVAWITRRSGLHVATLYSVHVAARSGTPSLLDEGAEIGGSSLALSAGELSWSDAGSRRSAPMR